MEKTRDRVLVTGGTGKTGRELVRLLAEGGVPVRAASRHPGRPAGGVAEAVEFDWARPETHAAALEGVGSLYLVPPALVADASGQVVPFLGRAVASGVRRIVHLSAMGVDAAPEEVGLRKIELAVMGSGAGWTILRPNWFMQNFSESFFLPAILERGELLAPAGDAAVSFIDARDIAAVAAAALVEEGHDGAGYALTGGRALTFGEAAEAIGAAAGREVRHVDVAPETMRRVMFEWGMPGDYAEMMMGLFGGIRAGWSAAVDDSVGRVLGRPPISFADYARDNADAWLPATTRSA